MHIVVIHVDYTTKKVRVVKLAQDGLGVECEKSIIKCIREMFNSPSEKDINVR